MEKTIQKIQKISSKFGVKVEFRSGHFQLYAPMADMHELLVELKDALELRFTAVFAQDRGEFISIIVLLVYKENQMLVLDSHVKSERAKAVSITDIFPGASMGESFINEMMGVEFSGISEKNSLGFLAKSYKGQKFPLRRYDTQ